MERVSRRGRPRNHNISDEERRQKKLEYQKKYYQEHKAHMNANCVKAARLRREMARAQSNVLPEKISLSDIKVEQ